ncbi:MAG: hypothetical protein ACM3NR_02375 [Methanosarcina sp.]
MKFRIVFIMLLALAANVANAQDQIVRRNGEIIKATVKEIGTTEIKYIKEDINKDVIFSIDNALVDKIIFADGKEYPIDHQSSNMETTEQNSDDLFLMQRKNALKLDFISTIFNTTSLTYERCLKPGGSVEFTIGAIGLGFSENADDAAGVLFKGGYKFLKSPDHYLRGMRYAHILKGRYAKMEFDFATFNCNTYEYGYLGRNVPTRQTVTKWALLIVMGSQSVFSDSFVIDTYLGVGVGKSNKDIFSSDVPHGFVAAEGDTPIAASAGLRIGFLLGRHNSK